MKQQLDGARTVVRALSRTPRCTGLEAQTRSWDRVPGPLWRKRLNRHVRECPDCLTCARELLPAEGLLAGVGLVPVAAAGSVLALLRAGAGAQPGYGAPHSGIPGSSAPAPDLAHPARPAGPSRATAKHTGHALKRTRAFSLGKVAGAVCAVVVVATASVVALNTGDSSPTPIAAPATATASPRDTPSAAQVLALPTVSTPPPTTAPPTTAAPATTKPAVVSPAKVAVVAKKGAATWSFSGIGTAFQESGVSWCYTWGAGHSGITAPAGVQFVPMIWGAASVTASNLATAEQDSGGALLGFNEPDLSSQSDMTPQQALALWPQLMSTGLEPGSPSVAANAATPGGWLDQFMQGARGKGYRVDFITVHWYGSDFNSADATSQLEQYLQAIHTRYDLPIWLTEYALINFSNGTSYPTTQQQSAFVTSSTTMLQSLSYVQRYSWFAFPATTPGQTGLYSPGGAPTLMGSAYSAAGE